MTWLQRWLQRRYDIGQGADVDLLADNARRFRLSGLLFGTGVLLFWVGTKWTLPHAAHRVLNIIAAVLLGASFILFRWAWRMDWFLKKPDREGPPSISKE